MPNIFSKISELKDSIFNAALSDDNSIQSFNPEDTLNRIKPFAQALSQAKQSVSQFGLSVLGEVASAPGYAADLITGGRGFETSYTPEQIEKSKQVFQPQTKAGKLGRIFVDPGTQAVTPWLEKVGVPGGLAFGVGLGIDIVKPGIGIGEAKALKGLKNLTTKFLQYAEQKLAKNPKAMLSKQEIMDFARRPELKKGEADLLLKKLEEFKLKESIVLMPKLEKNEMILYSAPARSGSKQARWMDVNKAGFSQEIAQDLGVDVKRYKTNLGNKLEVINTENAIKKLWGNDLPKEAKDYLGISKEYMDDQTMVNLDVAITKRAKELGYDSIFFKERGHGGSEVLLLNPKLAQEIKINPKLYKELTENFIQKNRDKVIKIGNENIKVLNIYDAKRGDFWGVSQEFGDERIYNINDVSEKLLTSDKFLAQEFAGQTLKELGYKQMIEDIPQNKTNLNSSIIRWTDSKGNKMGHAITLFDDISKEAIVNDIHVTNKGEGVGSTLYNNILEPKFKSMGATKIVAENVAEDNAGFWKSLGFDFSKSNPSIMEKSLDTNKFSSKLPAQEFADSIRRDLLELKPVKVKEPQYERTTIDRGGQRTIPAGQSASSLGKNYEEVVFESPITTNGSSHYPNSKNYFAHARGDEVVEGGKRKWREQEIQADFFEKINDQIAYKLGVRVVRDNLKELKKLGTITPEQSIQLNGIYEKINAKFQKDFPDLFPFAGDRFGERIMRERIKAKAQAGYEKYRLPTGETIGKIEGFETPNWRLPDFDNKGEAISRALKPEDLKVGQEVFHPRGVTSEDWIITDILGEGRFKAVPKNSLVDTSKDLGAKEIKGLKDKGYYLQDTETFDLTGKSNPQYRRYSDWGKFLKNKYGGKEVIDPQGNSWMEIDLKPEQGRLPVEAFGVVPLLMMPGQDEENPQVRIFKNVINSRNNLMNMIKEAAKRSTTWPDEFKPTNEYPKREPITTTAGKSHAPRIVNPEYKDAIAQGYANNPQLPKGILEAILMKESEMGTTSGDIAGFKQSAQDYLKERGVEFDLSTPSGQIKAMTDYLVLRKTGFREKKYGGGNFDYIDPVKLYMERYYTKEDALNDEKIFRHYFNTYQKMYE